jgi:predicted transcriptional regulator
MSRTLYILLDQRAQNSKISYLRRTDKIIFYFRRDFQRFVKNLDLLETVKNLKPQSMYAIAKHMKKDVANIARIAAFYEKLGIIKMKTVKLNGRTAKNAWVEYDQIIFQLDSKKSSRPGSAVLGLSRRRV